MVPNEKDAWAKAAACEAHAQATSDTKLKTMFRKLRDSWIRVANNDQLAQDVAANAQRLNQQERPKEL